MFPEPLKPCIVPSIRVALSLKSTLVSFYAWYRTFPPRFDERLNLSDLWLRSGSRRWRSTETTGMISRFVRPCICYFSHYMDNSQNDMLMWLMSEAKGVERSIEGLARRMLLTNFVSIHTTSSASVDIMSPPIYNPNHCMPIDSHTDLLPPPCQSRIYRTPPRRGRCRDQRRRVDESWDRQDVQDRQFPPGDPAA